MTTKTFDLEFLPNNIDALYDAPDMARVVITAEDVAKWKAWSDFVASQGAYCVEAFDYRCEFFATCDKWGEELPEPVASPFRQETSRVVVTVHGVRFTGYVKHGGSETEWSTEQVEWDDLCTDTNE